MRLTNVYSPEFAGEKLDYIHNNPLWAGIVRKPEEYIYSSATNYAEMESVGCNKNELKTYF